MLEAFAELQMFPSKKHFPDTESEKALSWKGHLNIISSNSCTMLKAKATGILSYNKCGNTV